MKNENDGASQLILQEAYGKNDEVDAIAEQTMKVSSSSSEMKSKYPQKNVQEDVKNIIVVCASSYLQKRNECIDEHDVSSIKSPGMNCGDTWKRWSSCLERCRSKMFR